MLAASGEEIKVAITEALKTLRERHQELLANIQAMRTELAVVSGKIEVLEAICPNARRLTVAQGVEEQPENHSAAPRNGMIRHKAETNPVVDETAKETPTNAVLNWLRQHPNGAKRSELVAELKDKIETTSSEPKRILYNTLINLERRQAIVQVQLGDTKLYFLPEFVDNARDAAIP